MFCKKGVLRNFAKFTGKHLRPVTFKKGTPTQVFSCEFCEISKSTFSYRTPPVAASEIGLINRMILCYQYSNETPIVSKKSKTNNTNQFDDAVNYL